MREAVVVASSRTALAKSFRGSFNMTRSDELAAHCIKDILRKTPKLDPNEIDDVVLGCAQPHGPQGHNVARISAMLAGLPTSIAGTTINRFCSSGLQAIALAAHQIINEGVEAAIGGGVESISMTPAPTTRIRILETDARAVHGHGGHCRSRGQTLQGQPTGAGRVRPSEPTAHSPRSARWLFRRRNRTDACDEGHPGQEDWRDDWHGRSVRDHDECNRPDTTLEGLLALKPHFDPHSGQGTVTAGNSSQLSDGASATLLMSRQRADQLGVPYKLVFRAFKLRVAIRTKWVSVPSSRCPSCSSAPAWMDG